MTFSRSIETDKDQFMVCTYQIHARYKKELSILFFVFNKFVHSTFPFYLFSKYNRACIRIYIDTKSCYDCSSILLFFMKSCSDA